MSRSTWQYKKDKGLPGLRKFLAGGKCGVKQKKKGASSPQPLRYSDYIVSPQWADFRRRWWATDLPKGCMACQVSTGIQLHHVTYKRLGAERMNDVVPLCNPCHDLLHERYTSHDCTGLKDFQFHLTMVFKLSDQQAAERLKPFMHFSTKKPKRRWSKQS